MLIDRAEITVRGGKGGFAMSKKNRGPDGGNGGKGGDVYFKASGNLNLLSQFNERDVFMAPNGEKGARGNKTGKNGSDIEIFLPIGTSIYDKKTNLLICEILNKNDRFLVTSGGRGGFNRIVRIHEGETKTIIVLPEKGEEKSLILSLRLIADFGFIGLPNSGKSSLLNELTNAKAPVANYEFTTLEPNLGVFTPPGSGSSKVIADIPGLIEGASGGKGLGISFLKHIEKVGVLLHCISSESPDPIHDYRVVKKELVKFNKNLENKMEIVLITKTDLVDKKTVDKNIKILAKLVKKVLPVSIYDFQNLEKLKEVLKGL